MKCREEKLRPNIKPSRRKAPRKSPIQRAELCWGFSFTRCWPIPFGQQCTVYIGGLVSIFLLMRSRTIFLRLFFCLIFIAKTRSIPYPLFMIYKLHHIIFKLQLHHLNYFPGQLFISGSVLLATLNICFVICP